MAVVDIGSNSTRLLIADVATDGELVERMRESVVTRLAEGVEAGGELGSAPRERVLVVLERYAAAISAHRCERATAVMTSAVRDAANGAAFAASVRDRSGLDGRILDGAQEAEVTFAGATERRTADERDGLLVVDIGGGSTELIVAGFHASLQVGVVRHAERHLRDDPPTPAQRAALSADVRAEIAAAVPARVRDRVRAAVAVAGTATTCAAIDLRLEPYDSAAVEGHLLGRAWLQALCDRLATLGLAERREVPGLHPDRAPVIVPGILILLEVLAAFGLDVIEASERDLLHGGARALAFG